MPQRKYFRFLDRIWDDPSITDPTDFLVMACLGHYADKNGCCYPGLEALAKRSRLSVRGIRKVLRRLEVGGHLITQFNRGKNGSNHYQLIIHYPGTMFPLPPEPGSQTPGTTVLKPRNPVPPNYHELPMNIKGNGWKKTPYQLKILCDGIQASMDDLKRDGMKEGPDGTIWKNETLRQEFLDAKNKLKAARKEYRNFL